MKNITINRKALMNVLNRAQEIVVINCDAGFETAAAQRALVDLTRALEALGRAHPDLDVAPDVLPLEDVV